MIRDEFFLKLVYVPRAKYDAYREPAMCNEQC